MVKTTIAIMSSVRVKPRSVAASQFVERARRTPESHNADRTPEPHSDAESDPFAESDPLTFASPAAQPIDRILILKLIFPSFVGCKVCYWVGRL
jgi:hypothetical protein